ncbi:hypothetical protein Tdes44962_MAKER03041 [Teratosphaeria destructans]|uniref:Uncharacterized protein n=1 Tax=Teratosphaeria destructans TaxID=418781 RepID=A0A9W7W2B0_9PEZI|nr:hypothetical protein Tdes44962_MAKER03041 [Teratosphaeria destructans]
MSELDKVQEICHKASFVTLLELMNHDMGANKIFICALLVLSSFDSVEAPLRPRKCVQAIEYDV